MTAKELIEKLKQLEPNAEVSVYNPYCNNCGCTDSDECDGVGHTLDIKEVSDNEIILE